MSYEAKNLDLPRETDVRTFYMNNLKYLRPGEKCIGTELSYKSTSIRADARTIDDRNLIREWEFKIHADYNALGQILTYVATAKYETDFSREIRGVIAAFYFREDLRRTVEVMNLNVDLILIPSWLRIPGSKSKFSGNARQVKIPSPKA